MPHSITQVGRIEFSDGPDRAIGGHQCSDQHDGITREGHVDSCCCCDPCRYIRPPIGQIQRFCCRCTPKIICATFTPDDTANECCRPISLPLLATFTVPTTPEPFWTIEYTGEIGGVPFSLRMAKEEEDGPCFWQVILNNYQLEHLEVDHVNVSCLSVPDVSISGVTDDNGCVGTISFSNYESSKIPFRHVVSETTEIEMIVPSWATSSTPGTPQCNCPEVPRYLCVDGIRHEEDSREQVIFEWDEINGDRWSYLPCDGNPTLDQEHIYLRGDDYGTCYLEFDFDQDDGYTNSWAEPQNTLGLDIHEIREGMVELESCGCDIHAHSVGPLLSNPLDPNLSQRFVNINAGDCGCWHYLCGTCRCVPNRLCVFGEIDGEYVDGEAIWDGEVWNFAATGYVGAFAIRIGPNECNDCVLTVEGTFLVPFLASTPVTCGEFLAGEVESEYDETQPSVFNWLWMSAAACPCNAVACGICAEDRCGGPPKVVYFDLEARSNFIPLPPGWVYEYCNATVVLNYYQRWYNSGSAHRIQCGYVGYLAVNCPATPYQPEENFVIRVSVGDDGFGQAVWQVDRADLTVRGSAGQLLFTNIAAFPPGRRWPPIGSSPANCDPFLFVKDWDNGSWHCYWGCLDLPVEIKLTFSE